MNRPPLFIIITKSPRGNWVPGYWAPLLGPIDVGDGGRGARAPPP